MTTIKTWIYNNKGDCSVFNKGISMPGGRPSKKDSVDLKQVAKLYKAGLTDKQVGVVIGVNRDTIWDWRDEHGPRYWPEFSDAIKESKGISDEKVVRSLWERATGYEHPEEKIHVNSDGDVTRVRTIKHYPPDTAAAFIWLKNRCADEWKDKHEVTGVQMPAPIVIYADPSKKTPVMTLGAEKKSVD